MNTTKIEEFVNKLAETGTSLLDNAPSYVREYLGYCFMMNTFILSLCITGILLPFVMKRFLPKRNSDHASWEIGHFLGRETTDIGATFAWVISGVLWLAGIIQSFSSIADMVAIKYYPSAYLIHEILGHKN